jgi:tRNA-splicing ligase RtcB
MYQLVDGVHVWAPDGRYEQGAVDQIRTCSYVGNVQAVALMADHHVGYSQPIGGVVAYRDAISPSGVGYDIGCGVQAARTNLTYGQVASQLDGLMDEAARRLSFGLGRKNATPLDHELFDSPTWKDVKWLAERADLRDRARAQLGTVGSGNHYVDILVESDAAGVIHRGDAPVWVACHFGSRGLGHKIASGFLNLAHFRGWGDQFQDDPMAKPTVIDRKTNEFLFDAYVASMNLALDYAYAGRDYVIGQMLDVLGAQADFRVHNHHNYAAKESHGGEDVWVVRKGATPAMPGQLGFVGGSMGDIAAVVEGVESEENTLGLNSTVHGAGRVMSRSKAKGNRSGTRKGLITRQMMSDALKQFGGVVVRGGEVDESPHVYRKLRTVLDAHANTIRVRHTLRPVGVVMAGADVRDPYRD